ncbi:MAG: VOC family protein [Pseudomonadales bacterium]|jgi:catechol 2,3-dioxygenase-like lactoylglutathione lyase family enzyme|nr:VOC family protein [Pseudomonadales bacterium]
MSEAMQRFGWGHVNLNVGELDRSIAFYELLGFSVFLPGIPYLGLARHEARALDDAHAQLLGVAPGTRGRACIMELGDGFPKLDLTELDTTAPAPPLGTGDRGLVRLCLVCQDLEAQHARLLAAGVRFLTPPRTGTDGLAELAVCSDPDGTRIELLQLHLERVAAMGVEL